MKERVFKTGGEIRAAARSGSFFRPTSGQAPNHVQANLVILPYEWSYDFLLFCQRNPKPCPLLEVGERGDPLTRILAQNADIRTDLPLYRIYRHGKLHEERRDIVDLWQEDYVFFLLGCSFTFESALSEAGLSLRHVDEGVNVPMYRTNLSCRSAGRFKGSSLVVSMRPYPPSDAIRAVAITRMFPSVHGSPVHIGDPAEIGIENLDEPDWGDAVTIHDGEIPVFWACGVTPQLAVQICKPPLMISHSPGHMFVGDRQDSEYRI